MDVGNNLNSCAYQDVMRDDATPRVQSVNGKKILVRSAFPNSIWRPLKLNIILGVGTFSQKILIDGVCLDPLFISSPKDSNKKCPLGRDWNFRSVVDDRFCCFSANNVIKQFSNIFRLLHQRHVSVGSLKFKVPNSAF